MVLKSGSLNKLGASTALAEDPVDKTLGARSLPCIPDSRWASDNEDSTSILNLVEEETTAEDQPRAEDKELGQRGRINASNTGGKMSVDNASHMFHEIKAHSTVITQPLPLLPEGINRTLYRVATFCIKKEKPSAHFMAYCVCQVTLTGIYQLDQCSITAGARAEVKTGTAVYGAHVGGCAHVWPARARTVA